jgi:solute carrier family 35 protein F1/2
VAHHPTRSIQISRIRAKPEKRNHLLSRWSEITPTTEIADEERDLRFDDNGGDDAGSIDGDVIHPPSSTSDVARSGGPHTLFGLIPIRVPKWKYALVAALDVYAQYTTILAYKYTTITNVALFDAFAIPSAIFVSRCFFGRRYTGVHILAVLACVVGIALNVIQDYREDEKVATEDVSQESEQEQYLAAEYPYKVAGDVLAIIGGILFGISNTLQEVTVKDGSLLEYLGCFTFFASIIASVQAMLFERGEIVAFYGQSSDETCSRSEGEFLFFIFAIGGMVTYAGVGAFLQFSDAAFFNLRWAVL